MRVLFWYCNSLSWVPAMKTLEDAPEAAPSTHQNTVAAFVHVEPADLESGHAETKLVKNAKWLARKWEIDKVILHSFTHLGEDKADPVEAQKLMDRAETRLETAGYQTAQTPYGYFLDLKIDAPGHPLARIFKEF